LNDLHKAIFENLETYKDLFDHAHDLIHLVEPDGTVLYVNNAWTRLLGFSQQQVQGSSIYDVVADRERDNFIAYRQNIVAGLPPSEPVVVPFKTKSGDEVYVEGSVTAKVVNGKTLYTRGIFRDVSARLRTEAQLRAINEQLREKEASLQQLLFFAPDAVVVIDANSRITYWNPKATAVFGWSSEEVTGRLLTELIIPEKYRRSHDEGMRRYLATGEAHVLNRTIEITALNKTGREFFVSLTISTTNRKDGSAFIAFIRDVDEAKRIALELDQKRRQLEISNQELEQFAHVASHDMKEPIRKVLVFTDQLRLETLDVISDRARNFIAKIQHAAKRMNNMVEGVLAYSSVQAAQPVKEKVPLDVVVKNVENDLELLLMEKGGVIRNQGLPIIEGGSFLLYQLFYNLISNSLKFSRPGVSPVIELSSRVVTGAEVRDAALPATKKFAKIEVRDNGIGFHQKHAEMIFKAFSRLHTKDIFEGTGLGLSLCRNIVEKHGGIIKAFGEENVGACFLIVLPLGDPDPA